MIFLNYGYAELGPLPATLDLLPQDEPDRLSIQLYHHVAGAVDLHGRQVLEIGCGRGGGSSYVMRYLKPASLTAIDLAQEAVDFCQGQYQQKGLTFRRGDAEALDFADQSFDAVINVESSHCYGNVDQFLSEVRRVLRPGGHFLFADLRLKEMLPLLESQLKESGLQLVRSVFITANVLKAMNADSVRRTSLIEKFAPAIVRPFARTFAGVRGSPTNDSLASGAMVYKSYLLRRPLK